MLADGIVEAFHLQARACQGLGSPLYGDLLVHAIDDLERGGVMARLLDGWTGNPVPDALVLRVLGAVHRLVLDGAAPELARFYPSVGGAPRWPDVWNAFRTVVDAHLATLRPALNRQVQTNEVRRSAALLGGFLTVAAAHGLPLCILEIGSSAGLNLEWDRYRYEVVPGGSDRAGHVWGDDTSSVTIQCAWEGSLDVFNTHALVAERAGCDLSPIDVCDPTQTRTLESFVWPDQLERLAQLRAAIALARRTPPPLTPMGAGAWLAAQLAVPKPGVATVVFHSIMWWYLPEEERERVSATIRAAGAAATTAAPVAWLALEPMTAPDPDLRLTRWPGGDELVLANADPHGRRVHWHGVP